MIYRFKLKHVVYFGIVLIAVVIVSAMCSSFAFFSSVNEEHGRLNIVTGTLNYKLSANDLINNKVSLQPGEYKALDIKITSLNTIDSKYELYYTSNSSNVSVEYSSTINTSKGSIDGGATKTVTIVIKNNSTSNAIITFGVQGGFNNTTLILDNNYNSIPSVALIPGLYDDNNNLLAAWDVLVSEYGLDVEKNYDVQIDEKYTQVLSDDYIYDSENSLYIPTNPSLFGYIVLNNPQFQTGTKLVVGNVSQIGDLALAGNPLKQVVLPDSITRIGDISFAYSTRLESIEIPANVTYIGFWGFHTANLSEVTFARNSKLNQINGAAFGDTKISSLVIPASVTRIDWGAFMDCSNLTYVSVEDNSNLAIIGSGAFDNTPWYTEASKNGTPTLNGVQVLPNE